MERDFLQSFTCYQCITTAAWKFPAKPFCIRWSLLFSLKPFKILVLYCGSLFPLYHVAGARFIYLFIYKSSCTWSICVLIVANRGCLGRVSESLDHWWKHRWLASTSTFQPSSNRQFKWYRSPVFSKLCFSLQNLHAFLLITPCSAANGQCH